MKRGRKNKVRFDLAVSLAPATIILITFTYLAMTYCIWLSFHRWNILEPMRWIGFRNYAEALHSKDFWNSLKITFIYVGISVPACVLAGMFFGMLLNRIVYARGFFRLMVFLPVVTSMVVAAMLWKLLFDAEVGLINHILFSLGFSNAPRSHWLNWLRDPQGGALMAVLVVGIWHRMGYNAVLFLGGLQGIPEQYREAAIIDGANAIQRFLRITLPLLSPTTFLVVVLQVIVSFRVIVSVFVLTRGGPVKSTYVMVYYLWDSAFNYFQMGYASALATFVFIIIMILTLLQFVYEKRVHYQ